MKTLEVSKDILEIPTAFSMLKVAPAPAYALHLEDQAAISDFSDKTRMDNALTPSAMNQLSDHCNGTKKVFTHQMGCDMVRECIERGQDDTNVSQPCVHDGGY